MIVVYHDVGGTHSTAVAANIHINQLSPDKVPDREMILNLPTFDKLQKKDLGRLLYIGTDEFGAKVYTISRQYQPQLVIPAITDMFNITKGEDEKLYVVSTSPAVNNLMRIGGYSSRRLGLVGFGRPIVTTGTLKAYHNIAEIVVATKTQIKKDLTQNAAK